MLSFVGGFLRSDRALFSSRVSGVASVRCVERDALSYAFAMGVWLIVYKYLIG